MQPALLRPDSSGRSPGAGRQCQLAELTISDFAVIEKLHLELGPGLSVITGETGAGKSIIIDALGAALGGRASSDWIRAGADRAWVEAVFTEPQSLPELDLLLANLGSDAEDGVLSLRRDVQTGRSVTRVNGRAAPGHAVEEVRARLVDVHSQGDHVSLLRGREQLSVLDRFGRLGGLRKESAQAIRRLLDVRTELRELEETRRKTEREAAILRHEVDEIEAAAPVIGEEQDLASRRLRLRNSARIQSLVAQVRASLVGDRSAIDQIGDAMMALRELQSLDEASPFDEGRLVETLDALESLQRTLGNYESSLEDAPGALEAAEERLLVLGDLKRKYGPSLEDVVRYQEDAASRLDLVQHAGERLEELQRQQAESAAQAAEAAARLSHARSLAARELEQAVQSEIADLGMPHALFSIELQQRTDPDGLVIPGHANPVAFGEYGIDEADFLVVTNPGEAPRPLAKVASGGELSRLMLAVKSAIAGADPVPVLIFDELDHGVGGRMGHVIGEKLWQLAREHQVLCITHLPQVACYGDAHYVVAKQVVDGRAATSVSRVEAEQRIEELALMLGGARAGSAARNSANELLRGSLEWKEASIARRK